MAVISNFIYIDDTGFHCPDYETILNLLKDEYRNIYGKDVYLEADSQDGQWISIQALALYETAQVAQGVYNSFSPSTATGDALSRNVKINGIRRAEATYSTVELKLGGQTGTQIPQGSEAKDKLGNKWITTADAVISSDGWALVNARAENVGAVKALAGSIVDINTPQRGWQTVTNPKDSIDGVAIESDLELRLRQSRSVALPSQTVSEGILGALLSLDGVQRAKLYENDTDKTDTNGLPPHSINAVVYGGDATAIGEVLANKKTIGVLAYGDTKVTLTDKYGIEHSYSFSRPTVRSIDIKVKIHALTGYLQEHADDIVENLTDYIEQTDIGGSIYLSKLYVPANLSNSKTGMTYDILEILVGIDGQALTAQNITLGRADIATAGNIHVELDNA